MKTSDKPFRPRILIADDEPDHARMTAELVLALWPHAEIRFAEDGSEAVAQAAQFLPELALIDLRMPVMDGHEVCRWLKSRPKLTGVKVIVGTAYHHSVEQRQAFESGADEYLTKPFSARDLWRAAGRLLGREELPAQVRLPPLV